MLRRSRRGRAQSGQAMVLALALIAFFSVITVSLAKFEDVSVLQVHRNQVTAATDSPIEGAAAYSIADASRGDWTCVGMPIGSVTMADATDTTVGYSTNQCNLQKFGQTIPGFFPCSLCALGSGASGGISDNKEPITIGGGGAVVSNSSLSVKSTTMTVTGGNIGYYTTVSGPLANYSPMPQPITIQLPDPLAYLPSPLTYLTASTTPPLITTNCSTAPPSPCLAVPQPPPPSTDTVYNPGVYSDLPVNGSSTTWLNPGVYVFTGIREANGTVSGGLSVSGGATLKVNCGSDLSPSACPVDPVTQLPTDPRGVLLYFTCGTSTPPGPQPCATGGSDGGALTITGSGKPVTLQSASTGAFAHVLTFYDPNDLGSSATSDVHIAGNGQYTFYGATYARSTTLLIRGNGNLIGFFGPIVTASMTLSGSGGNGLNLQGLGAGSATCVVFDNELSVAGTQKGHDGVQAGPGCVGGAEIVGFNYAP